MNKKILLIDDSYTQLASLKLYLVKAGYEVLTANDGAEGISLVYKSNPDLIISDIVMPEINGYQLCRLLKNDNLTKDIPIILLTCLNEKIDKFWGLRAGADVFLVKDDNFNLLFNKIQKFIEEINSNKIKKSEVLTTEEVEATDIHARVNKLLDQALIESTIVNEFRNLSEYVSDTKALIEGTLSLMSSLFDYNLLGLYLAERDEKKQRIVNFNTFGINISEPIFEEIKNKFFSTINSEDFTQDSSTYSYELLERISGQNSINDISDFGTELIIPIIYSNKVLGGICLYRISKEKLYASRIFDIIVEELKILMRIKWLYSETKFLSITDSLSGLYNRRYFQQALDREFSRAKRYKSELSLMMLDIDHFKKINDTYGHQFGDKVIAEISRVIKNSFRKTDYAARYGGEEIVGILPETTLQNAYIPLERLRRSIENIPFQCGGVPVKVTVSIGVASYNGTILTDQDLILKADQALYKAKSEGRNRVVLDIGS